MLLSGSERDNLPDSDFAYIEPGGTLDDGGKTTPRSKRHFPIQDADHVRDALARIAAGAEFGAQALPKVRAAAKKFGIDTEKSLSGYEHKSFALKIDTPPDDEGSFTGYAAVFGNVDKGNDVIEPGAVTKTLQENPEVPIFYGHDYSKPPIGMGTLSRDGKGVKIDGRLFLESSDRAREVHGAMKGNAIKGLSIGYNTVKRSFKGAVRHLQEIAIGEVSLAPTGFQMNPLAATTGVKALGQWATTESVDCVSQIVQLTTDYLASEMEKGDQADVDRIKGIMPALLQCLQSEIDDVATGEAAADNEDDEYGTMTNSAVLAIKELTALLSREPASATHETKGAAENVSEPDLSTLRTLIADVRKHAA